MSVPTSRAAVLTERGRLELQEFPLPEVGPDDGLLRVEAAGICGSDWEQFRGTLTALPATYPVIPGHEIVGEIHDIGERAAARWGVERGDRVAVSMSVPGRGIYGLTIPTDVAPALWGGYSEFMYLHQDTVVHRVPTGISPEVAALYVPLSNGVRWTCHVPALQSGDIVVVQGPGQQGLGCAIAAKEAGASMVIVAGISADRRRLEVARELGADLTVDVEAEDLVEVVREATDGQMADIVMEVSAGATAPVALSLDLARPGGQIVLAGLKSEAPIPDFVSDKIVLRGLVIRGSSGPVMSRNEQPHKATRKALEIMASGRYPLDLMCTHKFGLSEAETAVRIVGRDLPGEESIHITICPER